MSTVDNNLAIVKTVPEYHPKKEVTVSKNKLFRLCLCVFDNFNPLISNHPNNNIHPQNIKD